MTVASTGPSMLLTPDLCSYSNLSPGLQVYMSIPASPGLMYPWASSSFPYLRATTHLLKEETESHGVSSLFSWSSNLVGNPS